MDFIMIQLGRGICLVAIVITLGFAGQAVAGHSDMQRHGDCFGQRHCKTEEGAQLFNRIAVFPVYLNTDIDSETVAEIVDVSSDGKTLVYTDSETENLGFIDIENPSRPRAAGIVVMGGKPTSVAVAGKYALAAVNTSSDFVSTSGKLVVMDIRRKRIVTEHELGGQPDSIAVSPDGRYAAIAIENERDEDLGDGAPPQAPPGFLVIVDIQGPPDLWTLRRVGLTGIADLYPEDPEPEYVDINDANIAVVTLQENNHIMLVDLPGGDVIGDFSARGVDLKKIDTVENDLVELDSSLASVAREPDGISWISPDTFATADEGDLDGGSRGFTLFDTEGNIRFSSGNTLEHHVARLGHYPENRSENKGNEPENVDSARFGEHQYLFVASERSSVLFVYRLNRHGVPDLVQTLPAGVAPEGVKAIPERGLLVAASEEDSREDKIRSVVNIYRLQEGRVPGYPDLVSADRRNGTPIPWAALSGLATDAADASTVYTIHDSFYDKSRIYLVDLSTSPAVIRDEIVLNDNRGRLAAVDPDLVNDDYTVRLDPEGIAPRAGGGFWIASEGGGTVGDPDRPFETLNLILGVSEAGSINEVITLPEVTNTRQVRFGLEGIASIAADYGEVLFVAFQREWANDPDGHVRIGRYDTDDGEWTFYYYPIDLPLSDNGGWVGLSELVALDENAFAVVERDNQAGPDAAIKCVYRFSVAGLIPKPEPVNGSTPAFPVVKKTLVRDLIPDLKAFNGLVLEKIEGMTVLADGSTLIVNDNDGVDDSNGETRLLRLGDLFD